MRSHLGTSFKVWNRRRSWFWVVLDQPGNRGTIGTAATEAEAMREACASIETLAARPLCLPDSRSTVEAKARMLRVNVAYPRVAVIRVDGLVDERRVSSN
jgi:hypothetical protein